MPQPYAEMEHGPLCRSARVSVSCSIKGSCKTNCDQNNTSVDDPPKRVWDFMQNVNNVVYQQQCSWAQILISFNTIVFHRVGRLAASLPNLSRMLPSWYYHRLTPLNLFTCWAFRTFPVPLSLKHAACDKFRRSIYLQNYMMLMRFYSVESSVCQKPWANEHI